VSNAPSDNVAPLVHPLTIGRLTFPTNLLAAPVAGYSDLFFRNTVREFGGAGLLYAEMISAEMLNRKIGKARSQRLAGFTDENQPGQPPTSVQLWDDNPDVLLRAAETTLAEFKPAHIDLNFGCPASRVMRKGSGAKLLGDPKRIEHITALLVSRLPAPVSIKIRLGPAMGQNMSFDVLHAAENAGAAFIVVHGRYGDQRFTGKADWDAVARLKSVARIPVIGNGDLKTPEDIVFALKTYGVDGIMAARALIDKPWLFRDAQRLADGLPPVPQPTLAEQKTLLRNHFDMLLDCDGEGSAVLRIRTAAIRYGRGAPGIKFFRDRAMAATTADAFIQALDWFPSDPAETTRADSADSTADRTACHV
jgi:tRNA-dihydrouridine synthase B